MNYNFHRHAFYPGKKLPIGLLMLEQCLETQHKFILFRTDIRELRAFFSKNFVISVVDKILDRPFSHSLI